MKERKTYVLAPDSFKGSLTAKEVCEAMEKGIRKACPDAQIVHVPMADGGEGTTQALVDATEGRLVKKIVTGPLGNQVEAMYGILGDGKTAVIEMASASGIHLVDQKTKDPLITTTYGTGELIKECLDQGIRKIILGIGGSATNDGGAGMAAALGIKLLDVNGSMIPWGGGSLSSLERIDRSEVDPRLSECIFEVACDVTNPLCGPTGASHVFGPQKGAAPQVVEILDQNLRHYADVIQRDLGLDVSDIPGAGAAGGLGAGLLAFTNCTLKPGVEIVIKYTNLKEKLREAAYCFTGEGGIDFQTKFGKTPYGVAKTAKEVCEEITVVGIAGMIGEGIESLYEVGFDAIFGIAPGASELEKLLQEGSENIARTTENIVRLMKKSEKI